MAGKKRIVFSFDERSMQALEETREQGGFGTLGNTVRDSLQLLHAVQSQAKSGYTEVVVRNPNTGEERVLVLPPLYTAKR